MKTLSPDHRLGSERLLSAGGLALAFGLGALAGCGHDATSLSGPVSIKQASPQRSSKTLNSMDDQSLEFMANAPNAAEAREWLDDKNTGHVIFKMSHPVAQAIVEDYYESGAVKVFVVEISEFGANQMSDTFIIELPSDPEIRKNVFACDARYTELTQSEPVKD